VTHPLFLVAYPFVPSTRRHSKQFLTLFGGHLVCVQAYRILKVYVEGTLFSGICPPRMVGQMPTADSFCKMPWLSFHWIFPVIPFWYPSGIMLQRLIFFLANALHRVAALEWGTLETGTQHLFQECHPQTLLPYRWISLPGKWRDLTPTP
jgi:hypothetical protein